MFTTPAKDGGNDGVSAILAFLIGVEMGLLLLSDINKSDCRLAAFLLLDSFALTLDDVEGPLSPPLTSFSFFRFFLLLEDTSLSESLSELESLEVSFLSSLPFFFFFFLFFFSLLSLPSLVSFSLLSFLLFSSSASLLSSSDFFSSSSESSSDVNNFLRASSSATDLSSLLAFVS